MSLTSNLTQPKSRVRASVACTYCRSKRSRCDGAPDGEPCSQCHQKGVRCEFSDGRRNRRHYKPAVEALSRQVMYLEHALSVAQGAAAGSGDELSSLPPQLDPAWFHELQPNLQSAPDFLPSCDNDATFWGPMLAPIASLSESNTQSDTDATSHTLPVIAAGSGFGNQTTENSEMAKEALPTATTPGDSPRSLAGLRIPSDVFGYLIGLYFHKHQIMMHLVSQDDFMARMDKTDTTRVRDSLQLTILAAGLRYATRKDVLDRYMIPRGENIFAVVAKKRLERELMNCNKETLQALVILAEVETGTGNEMSGYLYSSMASRLLFRLRLDLSPTLAGSLSREEVQDRFWMIWTASLQDQYWSIQMESPPLIGHKTLKAARTAVKNAVADSSASAESGTTLFLEQAFEKKMHDAVMDVLELARQVTETLFALPSSHDAEGAPTAVDQIDEQLDNWLSRLPEALSRDPIVNDTSYHFLFVLHLIFHATKICLHLARAYSSPARGPEGAKSRAVTAGSAVQIAKLFETLRRRDDVRSLHSSGVQWAGLAVEALNKHLDTIPVDRAVEPLAHLQSLQRTLKEMARTFHLAEKFHHLASAKTRQFQRLMDDDNECGGPDPRDTAGYWSRDTSTWVDLCSPHAPEIWQ